MFVNFSFNCVQRMIQKPCTTRRLKGEGVGDGMGEGPRRGSAKPNRINLDDSKIQIYPVREVAHIIILT